MFECGFQRDGSFHTSEGSQGESGVLVANGLTEHFCKFTVLPKRT
jgi:hypothetical protein